MRNFTAADADGGEETGDITEIQSTRTDKTGASIHEEESYIYRNAGCRYMKKNLIFIGMPAVGKSTVGIVVAKRLGMNFIDVDLLIQEQEHKLLREIIAEVGQEGFLKIENQVNASIQAENSVISPGGSVVYCREAMEAEAWSTAGKPWSIIKKSEPSYI